jgi:hypothetical protein
LLFFLAGFFFAATFLRALGMIGSSLVRDVGRRANAALAPLGDSLPAGDFPGVAA